MRKLFVVLAFIFAIIGIAFAVLPLGTLALLPIGLALVFGFIAFIKSDAAEKNVPKWILIIAAISFVVVIGKEMFVTDAVAKDTQFEEKKIESKKEDMKDLEDLDNELQ